MIVKRDPLSVLFHRFASREVPVVDRRDVVRPTAEGHKLLENMHDTARKSGLSLRVLWPGMMATADYRADRVTAYIRKEAGGTYRIADGFSRG